VGVVGAHLCYADRRNQPSAGYEHTPLRLVLSWMGIAGLSFLPTLCRRVETRAQFYASDHTGLDWVSGAFLLTRRALWESLEGLDERYFMYVEDVDYCLRVKRANWTVDYVAGVDVLHYEGAGKAWIGETALLRTVTSYCLYLKKYYSAGVAGLTKAALGSLLLARSLAYLLRSVAGASTVVAEKRRAYFKAGCYLLKSH
jgi:N-acetylglucosaminyl-diphospho-decaprenol L-rhamnosyltransferase